MQNIFNSASGSRRGPLVHADKRNNKPMEKPTGPFCSLQTMKCSRFWWHYFPSHSPRPQVNEYIKYSWMSVSDFSHRISAMLSIGSEDLWSSHLVSACRCSRHLTICSKHLTITQHINTTLSPWWVTWTNHQTLCGQETGIVTTAAVFLLREKKIPLFFFNVAPSAAWQLDAGLVWWRIASSQCRTFQ